MFSVLIGGKVLKNIQQNSPAFLSPLLVCVLEDVNKNFWGFVHPPPPPLPFSNIADTSNGGCMVLLLSGLRMARALAARV